MILYTVWNHRINSGLVSRASSFCMINSIPLVDSARGRFLVLASEVLISV